MYHLTRCSLLTSPVLFLCMFPLLGSRPSPPAPEGWDKDITAIIQSAQQGNQDNHTDEEEQEYIEGIGEQCNAGEYCVTEIVVVQR